MNEENLVPNKTLKISSPVFPDGGALPSKYTCDGKNVSPSLKISGIPENTKTLALIVDDPDAPGGTWDHWLVFNISTDGPKIISIPEGTEPKGIQGNNSWGKTGYGGPCPPRGSHRYYFRVYALDTSLSLQGGSSKTDVFNAMQNHVIDQAELLGRYERTKN